jgi:hypothetical protein
MKITKTQLQKIVLETLKEAKAAKKRLLEVGVDDMTGDMQKIVSIVDKVPRFEQMMTLLNTRQEFYEFIEWMVDQGDDNLPGDGDAILAVKQTLNNLIKNKQQGGESSSIDKKELMDKAKTVATDLGSMLQQMPGESYQQARGGHISNTLLHVKDWLIKEKGLSDDQAKEAAGWLDDNLKQWYRG